MTHSSATLVLTAVAPVVFASAAAPAAVTNVSASRYVSAGFAPVSTGELGHWFRDETRLVITGIPGNNVLVHGRQDSLVTSAAIEISARVNGYYTFGGPTAYTSSVLGASFTLTTPTEFSISDVSYSGNFDFYIARLTGPDDLSRSLKRSFTETLPPGDYHIHISLATVGSGGLQYPHASYHAEMLLPAPSAAMLMLPLGAIAARRRR